MSKLAEAVRDHLNEQLSKFSTNEVIEFLDYGSAGDKDFVFNFEGKSIDIHNFKRHFNHLDGDGGEMATWIEIPDGDEVYYVGITGTYSSWDSPYWGDKFKIGKVRTWTESMFE